MEAALTHPPAWAERLVLLATPPACREAVLGDLCETYVSTPLYAREALRSVPFVIVSQMRRNANLPALGLQGLLVFICVGGFSVSPTGWTLLFPMLAVLGLLLRGGRIRRRDVPPPGARLSRRSWWPMARWLFRKSQFWAWQWCILPIF